MTPREAGFLLLSGHLGDPTRRPLSMIQLRDLGRWVRGMEKPLEQRELTVKDLALLGCGPVMAKRVLELLNQQDLLEHYLRRAKRAGCVPLTRVSQGYPVAVRNRLGLEAPGCIWARGDLSLLDKPACALVGSRDLNPENEAFAREVGRQAARQGMVLISGNARGADRTAQDSCLDAGGQVISVVADELERHQPGPGVLYLSEDDFDQPFSSQRALSRNRLIHCMGKMTFVAQSGCEQGGTWSGTVRNLRQSWNPVYCFDDGSEATRLLCQRGALPIGMEDLHDFERLPYPVFRFFDQW